MLSVAGLQRAAELRPLPAAAPAAARCRCLSSRPAPRRSARLQRVRASADEGGPTPNQPLAQENPALAVERQEERALAYGGLAALLGGAGLALAVAPARVVEYLWAATPATVVVSGLAQTVGTQLILAAIVAHCLKQAAEADHLKSDTYKRLNLALVWWGLGCTSAFWMAPQQPLRLALGVITTLLCATAVHAALTYQETDEQGLNPFYLARQFLSSVGNLTSYSNTPGSAIYGMYAYGLAAKAMVASVVAILFHGNLKLMQDGLMTQPLGTLGTSLLPVTGMGYALASVVLFTLKDAAKRGRLGASTFKALNIGIATVCLGTAVRMAMWMQVGVLVQTKVAAAKVAAPAFLAVVCLYNYAFAKK